MEQPFDFVAQGEQVCRLKKSFYGLKQSPRSWFGRFIEVVLAFGLKRCHGDFNKINRENILLMMYVDDIVIIRSDSKEIDKLKAFLQTKFQTTDLGVLKYLLGIDLCIKKKGFSFPERNMF